MLYTLPFTEQVEDSYSADARTILAVTRTSRAFSNVTILAELARRDSMRFLQFNRYSSKIELEKHLVAPSKKPFAFLYREAYASGIAFAPSMLDTLLYQASCARLRRVLLLLRRVLLLLSLWVSLRQVTVIARKLGGWRCCQCGVINHMFVPQDVVK